MAPSAAAAGARGHSRGEEGRRARLGGLTLGPPGGGGGPAFTFFPSRRIKSLHVLPSMFGPPISLPFTFGPLAFSPHPLLHPTPCACCGCGAAMFSITFHAARLRGGRHRHPPPAMPRTRPINCCPSHHPPFNRKNIKTWALVIFGPSAFWAHSAHDEMATRRFPCMFVPRVPQGGVCGPKTHVCAESAPGGECVGPRHMSVPVLRMTQVC